MSLEWSRHCAFAEWRWRDILPCFRVKVDWFDGLTCSFQEYGLPDFILHTCKVRKTHRVALLVGRRTTRQRIMKYIEILEILGSELLVLLLLLVRHCLSQWVLIFRRGHGLEVKSVELTEVSATPVGVTGRFPREFRDVEMKRWRLGFLEGKDNPLEGVPW